MSCTILATLIIILSLIYFEVQKNEKNKKWKEKVTKIAVKIAVAAGGAASWWEMYQSEEPEEISAVYENFLKANSKKGK